AGNTGYIPHTRTQIGQDEHVPAAVAGEPALAAAERIAATPAPERGSPPPPPAKPRLVRTDLPVEKFDVHTPGAALIVEQIIRPTGLLDPKITIRPLKDQIDETIELCRQKVEISERVLITTLTKRTAEDLSDYLRDVGLKVRYLHSD